MKKLMLIALMALILIACVPVQANTITMANPGGMVERDIVVYYANGTMAGYYNSTSVITLDGTQDYIFALKPMSSNPLDDPPGFIEGGFDWVQSNFIALLATMFLLAILARRFL